MSNDNEQWNMTSINWGMLSILITAVLFWTSVWYKELKVQGSYAYGMEYYEGRKIRTFYLKLR